MASNVARWLAVVLGGVLSVVAGCAHPGLIPAQQLRGEDLAPEAKPVKIEGLAKLGRPMDPEHRIQPGERLEVSCSSLFEEAGTEKFSVRVDEAGAISVPLVAQRLPVGSLTSGQAEQVVRTAYVTANLLRQPQVTVRTVEPKTSTVYVMGAVKHPGVYELTEPDECDPLRAVLAAGGLTEDAGGVVEIRRAPVQDGPQPTPDWGAAWPNALPSPAVVKPGPNGEDIVRLAFAREDFRATADQLSLHNGDVVVVEERKKEPFFVTGSVNKPGEFPTPTDREIHVLEAIGMAGGVNTMSEPTTVVVVRRLEGKPPVSIRVDLARAAQDPKENIRLMAGDLVSVQEDAASQSRRFIREFLRLGLYWPLTLVN